MEKICYNCGKLFQKFYVIFSVILKTFGRNYGKIENIAEKL